MPYPFDFSLILGFTTCFDELSNGRRPIKDGVYVETFTSTRLCDAFDEMHAKGCWFPSVFT